MTLKTINAASHKPRKSGELRLAHRGGRLACIGLVWCVLAAGATGCGQMGALYQPPPEPAATAAQRN